MGGRVGRKTQVSRRYVQLRKTFEIDMRKTRSKTIGKLEELFRFASAFARGQIQFTYTAGKRERISLPQRKRWLLVAGYTALLVKSIADGIDEKKIKADLDNLERLIKEACGTLKSVDRTELSEHSSQE